MKFAPRVLTVILLLWPAVYAKAADPIFQLEPGDITSAFIRMDAAGHTSFSVTFTAEKRAEFSKLTSSNLGKQIAVVVAGKPIYRPTIVQVIRGPGMEIKVSSPDEALQMAKMLLKYQP